jgi:cytochrome c-type biogenesis protein CcmH/NrfG
MLIYFWSATALLLILAFGFFLPWIRAWRFSVGLICLLSVVSYGLYGYWGSSRHLPHYYAKEEVHYRLKQADFQVLLADFRKEEFRLRLRLEQDPKDIDAAWRLLDLLAIKALQDGDRKLAIQYWESALEKVPKHLQPQFKEKILTFQLKGRKF